MLDDLREQASDSDSDYFDAAEVSYDFEEVEEEPPYVPRRKFLGMTPAQRFVIAFMLLLMTCLLSTFFLLITEIVVLPTL